MQTLTKALAILLILGGIVLVLASPALGVAFALLGVVIFAAAKKKKAPAPPTERRTYDLAGVNYRETELMEIAEKADDGEYKYTFPTFGKLLPDPENEHDPNAVKVLVGGVHVGFIPAKDAQEVKALLPRVKDVSVFIEGGPRTDGEPDDIYSGVVNVELVK